MAIYNGTLVKLNLSDKFLALTTYSRALGRQGRFLIDPGKFAEWIEGGEEKFYDEDIGYVIASKRGDMLRIDLLWHHSENGNFTTYAKQAVVIPAAVIQSALAGNPIRYLYTEKQALPKLDFSRATDTIREICKDKHRRRAFSKGLQHSFQWPGSRPVTFCGDTPLGSFFFREERGMCGGFILHQSTKKTPHGEYPCLLYSVHT